MKDQENFLAKALKSIIKDAIREELATVKPSEPEPLLLDTEAAAKLLAVPETWLAAAARSGKVKSVRLGAYVRFKRADLEKYIEEENEREGQSDA
jgi:excisionase family DNA binding protein